MNEVITYNSIVRAFIIIALYISINIFINTLHQILIVFYIIFDIKFVCDIAVNGD